MTDWTPLHGGEAFPAQPGRVRSYGVGVKQTGDLIEEQVTLLRKLAEEDSWYTEAADAFREKAEDLAGKIDKTRNRYQDTGAALITFADTVSGLESDAILKRNQARDLETVISQNPQVDEPTGEDENGEPEELTPAQEQQNRARATAIADLATVQGDFDDLVADAEQAARDCASTIEGAIDDDVKDDWWDRNAGWLRTAVTILGVIATIAAIVLLTVATGGTIWLVALGVAIAATAISLVINIGLALEADGSWTNVAIDAISLLTLGAGGVLTRLAGRAFPAVRAAVASFRGGRAFAATMGRFHGIPRAIYSFLSSSRIGFVSRFGTARLSSMADDALRNAGAAYDAVMAPRVTSALSRLLNGGEDAAQQFRVTRELLEQLRAMPDVPAELVQNLQRVRNLTTAVAGTTVVATVNDIVDVINEDVEGLQDLKGYKVVVDVINRLVP
jgi:hypothetical protein